MCIIIDINTLSGVFDSKSENHEEFRPVFDWVYVKKGKLVYGGTKYITELGKGYRAIFAEFRKAKKAVVVDLEKVDSRERIVSNQVVDKDFDDQHIVALLIESGCKLICSLDERAYPFFRHPTFFSPDSKRPRIYRGVTNSDLLVDGNIAEICRPNMPTTNAQRELITIIQPKS